MRTLALDASITERGAILLGENVACDAFEATRPVRVVTHAHADHIAGLGSSLRKCRKILMTAATKDLVEAMKGPLTHESRIEVLEYEKSVSYGDERITLFKAEHILGAAQVLVETPNGHRVAYTGDFKIEQTRALRCDTLVLEATYGNPSFNRAFSVDVRKQLVSLVEKQLRQGTVYVFGFNGKLQEVMQILNDADVTVPFIVPESVHKISRVYERHGMRLGYLTLSTERDARKLLSENLPSIAFYHMNSAKSVGLNCNRIYVTGWEFQTPCRQTGPNEYVIALSDHSDFNGLIEYVRRANPKKVVTDNYRISHGETLAKEIQKRLGIPAVALPTY